MTTPVNPLTTTTDPASDSSTTAADGTGLDSMLSQTNFLDLLVDQLKYQNPLDPTSSSDFMSQLAELSQVEQLQSLSSTTQMSDASSLLGASVTADGLDGTVTGTVTGVTNGSSGPLLDVAGTTVSLAEVEQINQAAGADAGGTGD